MNTKLSTLKKGDKVDKLLQPGFTAGGDDSYGLEITSITTNYDEDSGEPYQVIWVEEHGFAVNKGDETKAYPINSPWAYYLTPSND